MKKSLFFIALFFNVAPILLAQANKTKYPEPEFAKEIYFP